MIIKIIISIENRFRALFIISVNKNFDENKEIFNDL
jgi:hypothetical protein